MVEDQHIPGSPRRRRPLPVGPRPIPGTRAGRTSPLELYTSPLEQLIIGRQAASRPAWTEPDRPELLDAANELPCGHLPGEGCSC